MPNSSAKKKVSILLKSTEELSLDTKETSSESELQIDTGAFKTPTKKSETKQSPPNSNRKKKRRRIRKSSSGEDEKLDLAIEDIEDTIQSCIQKNKELTPEAIKIILRKLVKNEHVLAICRIKEEELQQKSEENGNDADDENDEIIPKLTRAMAKQMDKKLLPLVPLKQTQTDTEVVDFLAKEIHDDDETDPEYQPEEDPNTTISDMDSLPATPQSVKKPETEMDYLCDGVFKVPRIRNESLTQSEGEAEPICKRTRTRLCLETTPIETLESTLVAPDITVDMYDLDKDVDQHWADFLNEFTRPFNPNADDDDPNDPEFQPAEVVPLDKEELANVAISKKEYNTLLKELMEIVDTMDDSLLETTSISNASHVKEAERKLRSPRSVRKKATSSVSDSPPGSRKRQGDLHTPTPLEDSSAFVPNLMSTMNQSCITTINEESSVQIDPVFSDTVVTTESSKSTLVDTKSMISLSIQNPVNADQWISLDGFNLLSYAHLQDGVYYLPPTQKILIEVPTDQLLKSMSPQSETKIILSDSIQSLNTTNLSTSFNNSYVNPVIIDSNVSNISTVDNSSYVTKFGKVKQLKKFENVDLSPPPPVIEKKCTEEIGFSDEQRQILNQQLRMHIQLTTQNYLQTYSHPKYWQLADEFSNFLYELDPCMRRSEQHQALGMAIHLTQQWKRDVDNMSGKYVVDWFYQEWETEKECKKSIQKWHKPKLCPKIMTTMISNPVFTFPKLLPEIAFKSDYFTEKNKSEILTGEEMLISIGLDIFSKQRKEEVDRMNKTAGKVKWKVTLQYLSEKLSENLVKCRNSKAIYERILQCKNSSVMSPIKYWLTYGVVPKILYKIGHLDLVRTLKDDSLSSKWKQFLKESVIEEEKQRKSSISGEQTSEVSLIENYHTESGTAVISISKKKKIRRRKPVKLSSRTSGEFQLQFQFNYNGDSLAYEKNSAEVIINKIEAEANADDEEDLSLEFRLQRLKQTTGDIQKTKRGPKPTAKTYRNTLKDIIPVFIKNLNYSNRKYDKARVNRGVRQSKLLWATYTKVKALDIFSHYLGELQEMAASPQNIKKMSKLTPTTDKKTKVTPENDAVCAQNFFEKVEETLLTANKFEEFEKFANILKTFDPSKEYVADLYYKMEKIFHPNHPELLSLFLTFLDPGQAMQVGKFFEHFIMTNMSTFLEKLNKYFVKQPAQIKKIYNCLNELSDMENVTIEMVKESILPLLKGNPLLIDWFQQMFSNEKPIDYNEADSETINWKKTTTENVDSTEVYEELMLSDVPSNSESPACGVRYFQGNIMYSGRTCTLPAKISFLAYETLMQLEKKEQASKKGQSSASENVKQGTNCCHAIKTFADTRLLEKIKSVGNEKDTNSSHSSDEVEHNLAGESVKVKKESGVTSTGNCDGYYSTDDNQPKLADANTLKIHAIRLNPTVHARNGESFSDMSHLLTSPQNVVEKYFSDDTKSPTKKSSAPSSSTHISTKTNKKLLMSPKAVSKVIKSPPQNRKTYAEVIPDSSQALNTGKRLKVLIESDHSDIDSPISSTTGSSHAKRNKKLKSAKYDKRSEKEDDRVENHQKKAETPIVVKPPTPGVSAEIEPSTQITTSPEATKSEIIEPVIVQLPWTREEDKFILEEQRKGYENVSELVSRLKDALTNRTISEVTERFEFLMDLLRKIQQKE